MSRSGNWKKVNVKVLQYLQSDSDNDLEFEDPTFSMVDQSHDISDFEREDENDLQVSDLESEQESSGSDCDIPYGQDSDGEDVLSLNQELSACATKHLWTHTSINELLSILRRHGQDLPKDARTLQRTPRLVETEFKCGGQYGYFGIKNGIIKVINGFVLDYMHRVCHGVVRRLLHYLKKGKKVKLSSTQLIEISNNLVSLNGHMPSEFARQPRALSDLEYWKATEFRQFLLYTGPIVFRSILTKEAYEHFLALSIAIFIMLESDDGKRNAYLDYAHNLLSFFVSKCKVVYGETFNVYNVHNLHEDVKFFKCSLNEISCFPFENNMQRLKKFVRNSNNPIAQIYKRQTELQQCHIKTKKKCLFTKISCSEKDSCFLLESKSVAFVKEKRHDGSLVCEVVKPMYMDSVFKEPVDSKLFDIVLLRTANNCKSRTKLLTKNDLKRKCVCLPERRGRAIFPLLHDVEK